MTEKTVADAAHAFGQVAAGIKYRLSMTFYKALACDDVNQIRKIVEMRGANKVLEYNRSISLDYVGNVRCRGQLIALALLHRATNHSASTLNCVKELIRLDANVATSGVWHRRADGKDRLLFTTLQLAAMCNDDRYMRVVLKAGVDINVKNDRGSTALAIAAERGNVDGVRLLVSLKWCNVDVDAMDDDGKTALMLACAQGYVDIATTLVNAGADVNVRARLGPTAGMCGHEVNHLRSVLVFEHLQSTPHCRR